MDISTVKIINSDFEFLGEIEDYISFYFVRNFTKAKEFQIVAPIKYLDILKNDNIIFVTPKKAGMIEEVAVDESKKVITVKGRDLKSIIGRRVTVPPVGKSYDEIKATAEEVIKHYITNNCISPADLKRKMPQLELEINRKRGSTIVWQSRFKYLDFELEQICNAAGIGWEVYLDLNKKKFIFDVVEGIDRTKDFSSIVIFSEEFDNITNSTHTNNSLSYKTMGYVAGQGEGEDRTVQEVFKTNDTGLSRRELFIDARDIDKADNLSDRGKAKLSECDYITSNESIIINSNFIYEKDWDLGDIVILKNSLGESSQRISEVTEIYEGYRKIEIVLGSVIPLPSEKIANEVNSLPNSTGSSKMWRPSVDSNGNLVWALNSSLDIPATQNIKGPQGNQGVTGPKGEQGVPGVSLNFIWNGTQLGVKREDEVSYKYVDLKGQKGEAGSQGIQGVGLQFTWDSTRLGIKKENDSNFIYVDLKGATGERGIQGEKGIQGPKGEQGIQGPKGDVGAVGPKGDKGDTGAKGEQGIQGIQGPKGYDGKNLEFTWNGTQLGVRQQGQTTYTYVNLQGPQGIQGERGTQGVQGEQGPKGDKGDTGMQGAQGIQGPRGYTGSQGPKGDTGAPGPAGKDGTQIIKSATQPTGVPVGTVWI